LPNKGGWKDTRSHSASSSLLHAGTRKQIAQHAALCASATSSRCSLQESGSRQVSKGSCSGGRSSCASAASQTTKNLAANKCAKASLDTLTKVASLDKRSQTSTKPRKTSSADRGTKRSQERNRPRRGKRRQAK
jgi:hypothetical protein